MIFQHTHELVLSGQKTQTRRLCKSGEYTWVAGYREIVGREHYAATYSEICDQNGRTRFMRDRVYAVQPGRGKSAVGRIRIVNMWREDVRHISYEDAKAEGFDSPLEFLATWTLMHDPSKQFYWLPSGQPPTDASTYCYYANRRDKWVSVSQRDIWDMLLSRPDERYRAWVLCFEAVQE